VLADAYRGDAKAVDLMRADLLLAVLTRHEQFPLENNSTELLLIKGKPRADLTDVRDTILKMPRPCMEREGPKENEDAAAFYLALPMAEIQSCAKEDEKQMQDLRVTIKEINAWKSPDMKRKSCRGIARQVHRKEASRL